MMETRIDVTLDYLNGADFPIQWLPNVSPTRTPKDMCMHGRLFNGCMPLQIQTMTLIGISDFFHLRRDL